MTKPVVAITGASGYVGQRLTMSLLAAGHKVRALVRTPASMPNYPNLTAFRYALERPVPAGGLRGVGAVIHAAADTEGGLPDGVEQEAAAALLTAANQAGVARFVFISSLEAGPDARSRYARTKYAIEQAVLERGTVVRPGLVYGGAPGAGLFATLDAIAKRLPLLPALLPAPRVQPIHVEDLCRGIANAIERGAGGRVYTLAERRSVPFTALLRQLAWHRHGRLLLALPVPLVAARAVGRLAAGLLPAHLGERLAGFFGLRTSPLQDAPVHTDELGIRPRPLATGLRRGNARRRDLLEEAKALTCYVGGGRASNGTLARYVRAVDGRVPRTVGLGPASLAFPSLLRAVDPRALGGRVNPELAWRLDVALTLAEADRKLAANFHLRKSRRLVAVVPRLAAEAALEALLGLTALVARPLRRRRAD